MTAGTGEPGYDVEPWSVTETGLRLDRLAQSESVFALSNGHVGLRGNLDEGEPFGLPGTYLNAFYETRPLPYAEVAYGQPESGQTILNVTNGKLVRLLVDDEPFDVRYGELLHHQRVLDLRAGVLRREVRWRSPTHREVVVRSTRLVSFTHRSVAAICYEVEPCDEATRVVVQSELVTNEPVPGRSGDPRAAAELRSPLRAEEDSAHQHRVVLVHATRSSGLRMAAGMDHVINGPEGTLTHSESAADLGRVTVSAELRPGQPLRIVKLLAYGWSSQRSLPSLRDQVEAALASALRTGWEGLLAGQRAYLDDFWDSGDIEIGGDSGLQQAVRFGLFHTLQAGARAEGRAIPAKGLTGPGYDGHTFWDTEAYVLPVLTYTAPHAAGDALRWRHATLDLARERAAALGLTGAAFAWRTIRGQECSGYWPAGTAAFHINAAVADAVRRYLSATGDQDFERGVGLELLVETARLWHSLGHHQPGNGFRIDGVTGPDEYSSVADNNVYTNLMAQRNLRVAAAVASRHPDRAAELGVGDEEVADWTRAAEAMMVPYDQDLGIHPQSEGFTRHQRWDFAATGIDRYPLLLHFPYFQLYRQQVVKQADIVLALYLCGDAFTGRQKADDFAYYEALTVRDSSLSASIQAIVAAEVGHLDLAYDYFAEAALMDLDDLEHNTGDGLHIASLAGSALVAVAGFGGMRDHADELTFAPRLPARLTSVSFRLSYRRRRLSVRISPEEVVYELLAGAPLHVHHHGQPVELRTRQPVARPLEPIRAPGPAPTQPSGRAPRPRRTGR